MSVISVTSVISVICEVFFFIIVGCRGQHTQPTETKETVNMMQPNTKLRMALPQPGATSGVYSFFFFNPTACCFQDFRRPNSSLTDKPIDLKHAQQPTNQNARSGRTRPAPVPRCCSTKQRHFPNSTAWLCKHEIAP